jgi:hypothetical protein
MRTAQQKALVGPAGEHYVLCRLHQQGRLASLSPEGSPTVDVLVVSPDETVIASLQVKTRTYGRDRGWHMRKKHESIVPSCVVADVLRRSHQAWLGAPGAKGQRRNDNEMKRIQPEYPDAFEGYTPNWLDEWRERWDLLNAAVQP